MQQIDAAHAAGFGGVGLRLNPLLPTDPVIAGNPQAQQDIEAALARTGLQVIEVGVFPITAGINVEALAPVLAFSHKIGARFLTCPVEDTDKFRRIENFIRLCELAETCGLDALIEFNPYSACPDLEAAVNIVTASGRSNAKLLIDALHLSRSGGKPSDLMTIDPDLVALVHLCDAPPPPQGNRSQDELRKESRTARMYPGEGALWLAELLDVISPSVPLSIEAPSAAHAHLPAGERARLAFEATRSLLRRLGRPAA